MSGLFELVEEKWCNVDVGVVEKFVDNLGGNGCKKIVGCMRVGWWVGEWRVSENRGE